ncbi:MAG: RNA-binding S4 domain-containing protein [Lentimicrobiaceae bacterium]
MIFNIQPGHKYIQLNQLLKLLGLVETGGEANQVITDGEIEVNGQTETQKRKKLYPGDVVIWDQVNISIIEEEDD